MTELELALKAQRWACSGQNCPMETELGLLRTELVRMKVEEQAWAVETA